MIVTAVVLVIAIAMMAVERMRPGRAWPSVRTWWLRAIALNLVQVGIVFLAGSTWDSWLASHRAWSAARFGVIGGALLGYVVITFIYYWWHRARHESDFLWRWLHQVHHSPVRIEIMTTFYKHPVEQLVNGVLSSVRTPHWLVRVRAHPERSEGSPGAPDRFAPPGHSRAV